MLSVLLQWHREDPVDAAEVQHHETVAAWQGIVDALGWDAPDVVIVSGDAYVDHPSFAAALIDGSRELPSDRIREASAVLSA